jgi:hypothetical protein
MGFGVWGFGSGASDFGFRVSGFGFRVSDFGFRVSDLGNELVAQLLGAVRPACQVVDRSCRRDNFRRT